MSLRDRLRRAAELFVELPADEAAIPNSFDPAAIDTTPVQTQSVKQLLETTPGPSLSEVAASKPANVEPAVNADGSPNFPAIYAQAKLPDVAFGATQALEVIGSLPADLPLDVQRKTVGSTLSAMGKAMGVSTDSVVADASRRLAALVAFEDQLNAQSAEYIAALNKQIEELKAKIGEAEGKIATTNERLAKATALIEEEGAKLDDVIEFFTLDTGPSKNA